MMGRWTIRNNHYYGREDRTKLSPETVAGIPNPWVAVYNTPNYYDAREAGRFKSQPEALAYALSGGKPLDLTNTER